MKEISMLKKLCALATACAALVSTSRAISFNDVQLWTGSGTNCAGLVIEWSAPQSLTYSSVPVTVADKTLVWGYRFNGTNTVATDMLYAILQTDPRLYMVVNDTYGTFVEGIGYNLNASGNITLNDGTTNYYVTNGLLLDSAINIDSAYSLNSGDLYWGGYYGPNWEVWTETNDAGGFFESPNRGTDEYWTPTDFVYFSSGYQGQWQFSDSGTDDLPLTNGSWIAFSVASGEYEPDTNAPYNIHKHAPPNPDGTYFTYVYNPNDFAVQIVSTNNIDTNAPYNNPLAMLGWPTTNFIDGLGTSNTDRTKIIEPAYWTDVNSNDVITEISANGEVTVNMGRPIYNNPNNPYGVDLIVYGNSFYSASHTHGFVSDTTDLNAATLGASYGGHSTTVSVSQDGTNWFTYSNTPALLPTEAYRWDDTNDSWTEELMNPTKPVNPFVYTNNFSGQSVATGLDQFTGASGGTGFDLSESGFPWIQYVRIQPGPGTYTVIDAIAAVDPVVVGDALSIMPDNLSTGLTNLFFQNPASTCQNLISINFTSVGGAARISTVSLVEFSAYAPVPGVVSSAYKLAAKPVVGTNSVAFAANLTMMTSTNYTNNGSDLRVYEWCGTNWMSQPFTFITTNDVQLAGLTNFSAFVISQIIPPQLAITTITNGYAFQFTPVPNCLHTLLRSPDFTNWTSVVTTTPASTNTVSLTDTNAPAGAAYYRLQVTVP
jgi:hypothetical protein